MKIFFLCLTALAFCAAFTGCSKDNDTVKSTWESKSDAGIVTLQFIDWSTCSITSGSGKPGMYDTNYEIFDYWPYFGPHGGTLYNRGDVETPRYSIKYSDERHLTLIPIREGEEVLSDAVAMTRIR